ncbi:protein unc-79 homolog [Engraulis encrasicolus]|uniref:protein unc-79 homolog n=1 Tax=Engraulis encrasicolus TaxID=184585 RepID=UPI002FD1846E
MSTKAEQFAAKVRVLQEYHNRVLHNLYPVPSGTDIANTLKYFSQTLLSILSCTVRGKEPDNPSNLALPMTMCLFPVPFPLTPSLRPPVSTITPTVTRSLLCSVLRDAPTERAIGGGGGGQSRDAQLSEYPSLDYQALYATLVTLLDLVPLLQHGQHDLGLAIFYTTTCLLPFLSDDILSTLPFTMISTLATFPPFLHKDIIEYLSTSFLPMAILGSTRREGGVPTYVNLSACSMLMIAMQYTSNPVYHCQLLECLMKHKQEVWKDLLYVISYGPSQVKPPAVQMLFHYWPNLKPPGAISEYRGLQYTAWNPIHCQHIECHNAINKPAVKMCIDPTLSVAYGDKPPPLYICEECSQRIAGDRAEWLVDVLLPQAEISAICQKKNCSSHVRRAVVTCFSAGCCGHHGNKPVRYCKRCHVNHHSDVGASAETHLYQTSPPPINTRECGAEELVCTVEAVISLLKEAEIHAEQREFEMNRRRQMGLSASHHSLDNTDFDNKEDDQHDQRLLSQFGIWFLVSLCTPSENTPTESLARLVSMVFQWFHSTAYMMDDEVGSLVEKLKPQFVTKWLKTVCDVRFDVMVMCLLPKPVEFARVGGYWDKSCSTVTQLKEGLNRILCLIPYNVISQPLWDCFMPEWLEAIRTEVPDHQLKEFREVLSKMFDTELCPLPFSMEEMFSFISCRFTGYPASVQEQALLWLHVLSELDIVVPLQLLIDMFSDGVNSLKELTNQRKVHPNDPSENDQARRVSVVSEPGRRGVQHQPSSLSPFPSPFRSPLQSSPFRNLGHMGHAPGNEALDYDTDDDDMNLACFILMFDLILKQMELQDDGMMLDLESSLGKDTVGIINNIFQAPWGGAHTCQKEEAVEKATECSLCQSSILCYQLGCQLLTRLTPNDDIHLVDTSSNLEDSLIFPRPDGHLKKEESGEEANTNCDNPEDQDNLPNDPTGNKNAGKEFSYDDLPVSLKLIYTILQDMAKFEEPDILYNMLNCLRTLCLRGECLCMAKKDHPQFLSYVQEKMLIPSLWNMLKSEFCQLAALAVPQLLHALTLCHGADIFWRLVENSFNNADWKIRFEAVERVAVLCRFLDMGAVTKSHVLKYSLAHAFCCFLASVEDVNPAVATRANLLLNTIKRPALQGLCVCLDFQFDTVIRDRPVILSKLLLLHNLKKDIPALSWEFFVNRFETLSLEAQLHLDCNKDFPFPPNITSVRTNLATLSDAAMWKIRRARFARNQQKSVRSLRDSIKGGESKRAFSLPETLCNRLSMRLTRQEHSAPTLGEVLEQVASGNFCPPLSCAAPQDLPSQSTPLEDESLIIDLLPEDAGIDHQTVHHLITVLMKFMAKDQSSAEADISSAKAFNTVKRHLYVLLGYDQQEGCFMVAPQKMRTSTCFNAFIAGIAQVMDYNIGLGKQLLPLVVQVLKYCACPQLRHCFQQPPRCSLWPLKPHIRQMWLKALLVILYKYPYREMDVSKVVLCLIHITINTLNAQYHSCRPHATAGPLYSDNSNMSRYSEKEKEEDSVFDESDVHDTPTGAGNKESQTFFARLKRIGGNKSVKYQPAVEITTQKSEMELLEYHEDAILHCVHEESSRSRRLQAMHKQKSLDIEKTDAVYYNLDEHRRKSCIDRTSCDLHKGPPPPPAPPPPSSSSLSASSTAVAQQPHQHQHQHPHQQRSSGQPHQRKGSSSYSTGKEGVEGTNADLPPTIPELRLSCTDAQEDSLQAQQQTQLQTPPHRQQASPQTQLQTPHRQQASPQTQQQTPHRHQASPQTQQQTPHRHQASPQTQQQTTHRQQASPQTQLQTPHRHQASPQTQQQTPHRHQASPQTQQQTPHRHPASPQTQQQTPHRHQSPLAEQTPQTPNRPHTPHHIRHPSPLAQPLTPQVLQTPNKQQVPPLTPRRQPSPLAQPLTPLLHAGTQQPWPPQQQQPPTKILCRIEVSPSTGLKAPAAATAAAAAAEKKEEPDLIDLSSNCTSFEKNSTPSASDSDSLVFEPLPPLCIVESDDELPNVAAKRTGASSTSTGVEALAKNTDFFLDVVEACSRSRAASASHGSSSAVLCLAKATAPKSLSLTASPAGSQDVPDFPPGLLVGLESPMTLKQKRDLFRKTSHVPNTSVGDSPSSRNIPGDASEPSDPSEENDFDDGDNGDFNGDDQESDGKLEEDDEEDATFKIQIIPRQRKQRKIAVSAIQREYLDISFGTLDKLGEQTSDSDPKALSSLERPLGSASAPALEAANPEASNRSSVSSRQVKRNSLGTLHINQLKKQLEHQSSAPHNISIWESGQTKSSLLSAPSSVSMFVPAPEEFTDDQPTTMTDRCRDCGAVLEEYDEDTLGLAVVVLSMFIHLSPDLAAPLLLEILQSVSRLASSANFAGQAESMLIPGNAAGVAKQFLRCVLHQLAPNGILPQLFQSNIKDGSFLRTMANSLIDFNELSSVAALNQLLEGLNNKKSLPAGSAMLHCLENIAVYMEALAMDVPSNLWSSICNHFQTFFTRLPAVLPLKCPLDSAFRVMLCLLKIPATSVTRSLLEPFSKLLSFVVQYSTFSLSYLVELCGLCYKTFNKERDRCYISRIAVLELLQALKFKSPLPDTNLLLLVQFVCSDLGTRLAESTILQKHMISSLPAGNTAAMECMRQYINEVLDFIADMHTLTKLKSHMKACCQPLHEDTFGGNLKVGLAQVAAMEISKGNHRDNRSVVRHLPWLYHPPSALQQGPKEFIECVSHIRLLSWLLLGSLTHVALHQTSTACMPIPLDAGSQIADHLIVILIGFPEQSKTSVLHMCSLFHAFMFAQLWTVYCEQAAASPAQQNQNLNEYSSSAILTGLEFWSRVTPSILQLMAHNKVMVEMVCLHVISLMEALQECNSTIFVKLIPMWLPMIQSNLKHLSAGLHLRLQAIQNRAIHHCGSGVQQQALRKWLQCTQFKMAQVEIQSSEAASQFYPM